MTHHTHTDLCELVNYIKGDYHENLKKCLKYIDGKSWSFDNWDACDEPQTINKIASKCICSHDINEQNFIKHKITGDILTVGSRCIKRFCDNQELKDNLNLIQKKRKNPNAKYCARCNKKVNDKISAEQNEENGYYHKSCITGIYNKCWKCDGFKNSPYYKCDCEERKAFIKKQKQERIKNNLCIDCDEDLQGKLSWVNRCVPCYNIWEKQIKNKKKHNI